MNRLLLSLVMFALVIAASAPVALAADARAPRLVTPAWVAEHQGDPNLVVLHVASMRRDYASGHVPGARYLWTGALAQSTPDMTYEVVPVERIQSALEALGVSDRSRIVLCGVAGNVSPVARMCMTLEYAGLGDSTSILDGQFEAWKADGRPVSTQDPKVKRGTLHLKPRPEVIVSAEWMRDHLRTPGVTIVDARPPQAYAGTNGALPRAGHIPGAKNLLYSTLVDSTNHLLPQAKLEELFQRAGIEPGTEVAAYCFSGQTGCVVYLAAELLGHKVHLYDGSFDEWGGRLDLPIEVPAPKPAPPDTTRH
jgi:thiosulfate/3-mercaptopyruvate sulfurtransferase